MIKETSVAEFLESTKIGGEIEEQRIYGSSLFSS